MKKISKKFLFTVIVSAIISIFFVTAVSAESEQKKVKIGWFYVEGFQCFDENGRRTGYGYDYLQEISRYTGIEYEFIEGSWEECMDRLASGEIDLVSFAQYTPERDELFDYSTLSLGQIYAQITTLEGNDTIREGDVDSLDKKRIGAISKAMQISQFKEFVKDSGIEYTIKEYAEEDDLVNALHNGDIDLILHNSFRVLAAEEKVVSKFAPKDIYFMVQDGNDPLLSKINEALEQINTTNLYFNTNLMKKYYSSNYSKTVVLTKAEQDYLKELKTIKIVSSVEGAPFFYEEKGEVQGINADVVREVCEILNIECEFIIEPNYYKALSLVQNKDPHAITGFFYDYSWAEKNGLSLTTPYLTMQYSQICRKNTDPEKNDSRIAVVKGTQFAIDYVEKNHKENRLLYYETTEECIKAVNNGEADITYANLYTAEYYAKDHRYKNITSTLIPYKHDVCIAVAKTEPIELGSALSKALSLLSTGEIERIIINNTDSTKKPFGLRQLFYDHPIGSILVILSLASAFILLLLIVVFNKNRHNKDLLHVIYTDGVTGCPNFEKFRLNVNHYIEKHQKINCSIVYIDIQNFKYINDTFGHFQGDLQLKKINKILLSFIEEDEFAARAGADHFVLKIKGQIKEETEERLALLIKEMESISLSSKRHYSTLYRVGVYFWKDIAINVDTAVDFAIYAQKALGSISTSSIIYFDQDMHRQILLEKDLEKKMRPALENKEFILYFQPKVDIVDNKIIGAEALVRWQHPVKGFLLPGSFIPFFEKCGFIVDLDLYIFEEMCKYQKRIIEEGVAEVVPLSCNVSRRHLQEEEPIKRYLEIYDKYKLPRNTVELELTENGAIGDMDIVTQCAKVLKNKGILRSIDDFGSGYSSVQLLYRFPIDYLKMDRSVILGDGFENMKLYVLESIVETAEKGNITVIWEGVETKEQADLVRSVGGRYIQGFLFGKPMPFHKFYEQLKNGLK